MQYIYILFIIYIFFLIALSIQSYKKGLFMFWISSLIIPTMIFNMPLIGPFTFSSLCILAIFPFVLLKHKYYKDIDFFLRKYYCVIIGVFFIAILSVFLTETVPVKKQIGVLLQEFCVYIIIFITFFSVRTDFAFTKILFRGVCAAIFLNIVFSAYFEIFLRENPCGLPLYIFMGQINNVYLIDAIDSVRGSFDFRLQSIFGHPLSLGQYFLIITPVFFVNNSCVRNIICKIILVLMIIVVFLTGTRGAYIPLLMAVFYNFFSLNIKKNMCNIIGISLFLLVVYLMLPVKVQMDIDDYTESFVAGVQFWDSDKQSDKSIHGSSVEMRLDQFDGAIQEVKFNLFFGRGIGYREWYQQHRGQLHPRLLGYESFVLLYLVERGVVGLILFSLTIFCMFIYFWKYGSYKKLIFTVFACYFLSITLTGVRPLSLMYVGLCVSLLCGFGYVDHSSRTFASKKRKLEY